MKCSLGISSFLEEIPTLSLSIVFLYFFALIAGKAFLSFLAILWNSAFNLTLHNFLHPRIKVNILCKRPSECPGT